MSIRGQHSVEAQYPKITSEGFLRDIHMREVLREGATCDRHGII